MRINEIITEQVVQEISRPDSVKDAGKILHYYGYEELGSGMMATVFHRENEPYVLKLFAVGDEGYNSFLRMASMNKNTHFSIFKGKPITVNQKYRAVRMEMLRAISGPWKEIDRMLLAMVNAINMRSRNIYATPDEYFKLEYGSKYYVDNDEKQFFLVNEELLDACILIGQVLGSNPDLILDLHDQNVMERQDGTVVITDPLLF